LGTDIALLGLSGAGAVASAATAKTILASISAGVTGTRTAVDKDVFFEKTMPALLEEMDADRKMVLVDIQTGLTVGSDRYSLFQAVYDLDRYYRAGTIPAAVASITKMSSENAVQAEGELKDVSMGYKADVSSTLLRKFWKPNGKTINPANESKLRQWMKDNAIEVSITSFMIGDTFSEGRARAARDLKIE
jgi:hypothetical protein